LASRHSLAMIERKAEENRKCAILAEGGNLRNSAVSRWYYACLLYAKHYILTNNPTLTEASFKGKGSHKTILNEFNDLARTHANYIVHRLALSELNSLKSSREKAEYSCDFCFSRFDHEFEYNEVRNKAIDFIAAINTLS